MAEQPRSDVAEAIHAMKARPMGAAKRALKTLEEVLEQGEKVFRIAAGTRPTRGVVQRGLLVLTDRRLMFVREGMVRSAHESIPLDLVTAVAVAKGIAYSKIKTTGSQSNEILEQVNKHDAEAWVVAARSLLASRSRDALAASLQEPVGTSVADELSRLADLRDRGVLTDPEFATQKARLLGS